MYVVFYRKLIKIIKMIMMNDDEDDGEKFYLKNF